MPSFTCAKCGLRDQWHPDVPNDLVTCAKCGSPIGRTPEEENSKGRKRSRRKRVPALIILGIALVLAWGATKFLTDVRDEIARRGAEENGRAPRPDPATVSFARGNSHLAQKEYDQAIEAYGEAIRLNPNLAMAYNNRGSLYTQMGQHDQAIQDYDEALRLNPELPLAYYNRGTNYLAIGKLDETIADLTAAIRLDPKQANAYHNRGLAHRLKGRIDEAILDHAEAVRLAPDFRKAHFALAFAYAESGNFDDAVKWQKKAIRLGLDNEEESKLAHTVLEEYQRERGKQ